MFGALSCRRREATCWGSVFGTAARASTRHQKGSREAKAQTPHARPLVGGANSAPPPGTFSRCCLRPRRQLWGGFILYTHAHTGKQCSRHAKWMPHGRLFVVRNLLPEFVRICSIIISPMVPSAPAQAPFAGRNIAPILGRSLSGSFETVAELLVPQRDNRRRSRVRALQGGAKSSGGARGARIMAAG
jgi:hypothetical protein